MSSRREIEETLKEEIGKAWAKHDNGQDRFKIAHDLKWVTMRLRYVADWDDRVDNGTEVGVMVGQAMSKDDLLRRIMEKMFAAEDYDSGQKDEEE